VAGVVGRLGGAEPSSNWITMLDLTTKAEVDGVQFDGVDLFLFAPHVDIDSGDDDLMRLADKVRSRGLVIGSVVLRCGRDRRRLGDGDETERKKFVEQVRKGCGNRQATA